MCACVCMFLFLHYFHGFNRDSLFVAVKNSVALSAVASLD